MGALGQQIPQSTPYPYHYLQQRWAPPTRLNCNPLLYSTSPVAEAYTVVVQLARWTIETLSRIQENPAKRLYIGTTVSRGLCRLHHLPSFPSAAVMASVPTPSQGDSASQSASHEPKLNAEQDQQAPSDHAPANHDQPIAAPVPQTPQTYLTFLLVSGRRRTMSFDPETTIGRVKEFVWNAWPSGEHQALSSISTRQS